MRETNVERLKRARMSLAQAVTRSLEADDLANRRAVDEHRAAAELRLIEGGAEDIGRRLNRDLEPQGKAARKQMRELMQLIDARLEVDVDDEPVFDSPTLVSDGGDR
jgi:hypothetical protein